jgi:hypothetical protein
LVQIVLGWPPSTFVNMLWLAYTFIVILLWWSTQNCVCWSYPSFKMDNKAYDWLKIGNLWQSFGSEPLDGMKQNHNHLSNQYISPLTLWVWIPLRQGALNTTVSSTNKTDCHDITEILLNILTLTQKQSLGGPLPKLCALITSTFQHDYYIVMHVLSNNLCIDISDEQIQDLQSLFF